jgi:hypothetical protein
MIDLTIRFVEFMDERVDDATAWQGIKALLFFAASFVVVVLDIRFVLHIAHDVFLASVEPLEAVWYALIIYAVKLYFLIVFRLRS